MENDNSIEYKESDERVEIDPRDVRKMNEPICVIKLPNGNYKQPTKKEIKLLEEKGMSNPCLGKSNSSVKPQTTKKVAASSAKGASSNVTKKMAPVVETSKPAVATNKPTANVSDLKKELENIKLEQQRLEAEKIAAEEARIAAAAEEERATLEGKKKLEKIRASKVKAKNEKNKAAEREAEEEEEKAVRVAAEAEAVRAAKAEEEAVRVAEVQRAKTKEVNTKFQMFVENVMRKVKEQAAAEAVKAAAQEQAAAQAQKEALQKLLEQAEALQAAAAAQAEAEAAAAEAKLRADPTQRIEIGKWSNKNQIDENGWKERFQILQDETKYGSGIRVIPNTTQKVNKYLSTIVQIFFEETINSNYKEKILDKFLEEPITSIANDNNDKIGTNFEVSYNGKVRQVTYDKDSKTFSFTESSSGNSNNEFTVENIKNLFGKKTQGGSKKYNKKYKKINLKLRKTTLKKRKGKKYNKKRYTIRKKSLTRNKVKSRSSKTKTKTKTKKQKRGIKKPRYTKRRY